MFCIKCGAKNSDEAVYCLKCGTQLEAEEETRIVKKNVQENELVEEIGVNEDEERKVFSISPTLMFVKIGYGLAVLGAFLLVALFVFIGQATGFFVPIWLSILFGLALLLIPAFYHFKKKAVCYTLTDSKIEIDEGFIFQNSRNIPLRSIQDVSVSSTITQRMLGFGNLVIDNASEDGGKIVLKNINTPKKYADILLKQMRLLNK